MPKGLSVEGALDRASDSLLGDGRRPVVVPVRSSSAQEASSFSLRPRSFRNRISEAD